VIPLAGKGQDLNLGYMLLLSIGGTTYNRLATVRQFNPHATLTYDYPAGTYEIDDQAGLTVDFDLESGADQVETVGRAEMLSGYNAALLGDEAIAFETVTPVGESETRFLLTGVVRGMLDTEKADHSAGEDFYFISRSFFDVLTGADLLLGSTRYFKLIPYNAREVGEASDAEAVELAIGGRSYKPYRPWGFQCNSMGGSGTYGADCVLTWSPRLRTGAGAGLRSEDQTDAAVTWEGYFEIRVYVGEDLVRTATAIDAATWTYTAAMNEADNGALGEDLTFWIKNYIDDGPVQYSSGWTEISVLYSSYALVSDAADSLITSDGDALVWRSRAYGG